MVVNAGEEEQSPAPLLWCPQGLVYVGAFGMFGEHIGGEHIGGEAEAGSKAVWESWHCQDVS